METCADCGKPIDMHEASYYRRDPTTDIGKTYHSMCGDPFGTKAKDAKINVLVDLVSELREALRQIRARANSLQNADSHAECLRQLACIDQIVAKHGIVLAHGQSAEPEVK